MKIYYNNFFDDYTAFVSTESAAQLAENVQNIHLVKKWLSEDLNDQYIGINAGASISPTAAFLLSTNLTDAAVVKIQGHPTNSWGAPDVNLEMTRVSENLYYVLTGFSAKQYWRFYIDDPTNDNSGVEIGRAWLGDVITITKGANRNFSEQLEDTSIVDFSKNGQVYGDVGYRFKKYVLNFPYWTDTMKTTVDTFVSTVIGGQPFILAIDESNLDKLPFVYTIIEPGISYNHMVGLTKWNSSLTFREVF